MLTRRRLLTGTAAAAGLALACQRRARTGRVVAQVITAAPGKDGAGVALRRSLGSRALPMLDPFLMLDEIHSADPADYQAGFPTHPHRGFETVSYVLRGGFAHADSVGNRGLIADGGAQWMTAGRGIVHSEMPQPTTTREVWGLQLWVNLPAARKLIAPRYQDLGPAAIPTVDIGDAQARVVAGAVGRTRGPVDGIDVAPTMLDVTVPAGAVFALALPGGHAACAYVLDGAVALGATGAEVTAGQLAVLSPGDELRATRAAGGR